MPCSQFVWSVGLALRANLPAPEAHSVTKGQIPASVKETSRGRGPELKRIPKRFETNTLALFAAWAIFRSSHTLSQPDENCNHAKDFISEITRDRARYLFDGCFGTGKLESPERARG